MWTGNKQIILGHYSRRIIYEFKCDKCGLIEWRTATQFCLWKWNKSRHSYCIKCRKIWGFGTIHRQTINNKMTKLYSYWMNMKKQCCEEWLDFNKFKEWAESHGYSDGKYLDRFNLMNLYYPENCYFTTKHNKLSNYLSKYKLTYQGQTLVIRDWANLLGLKYNRIYRRLRNKRPIEEILTLDDLRSSSVKNNLGE